MSTYDMALERIDSYMLHLNGGRSTLEEATFWTKVNFYDANSTAMLIGAIALHTMAVDKKQDIDDVVDVELPEIPFAHVSDLNFKISEGVLDDFNIRNETRLYTENQVRKAIQKDREKRKGK